MKTVTKVSVSNWVILPYKKNKNYVENHDKHVFPFFGEAVWPVLGG